MAAWDHSALGFALARAYSFDFTQKLKVFDVAGGSTRFRLNDKFAPYIVTLTWNFTEAQFKTFETFYKTTLLQGSLPFDMILLTGVGFVLQVCNFDNGYSYNKTGNDTKVTAQILVKRDLALVTNPIIEWILAFNFWEDTGFWDDTDTWND